MGQNIVFVLWVFVQIGLLLAKFYVQRWASWYGFMQGFHIYVFCLYGFARLKCGRFGRTRDLLFLQAALIHILVPILSYHSITGFLLTGFHLIHASVWPWVVLITLSACS